jgi:hypothetical protein
MTVDEWDYREVCSDGSCVGVIGADGTCKVCGTISPTWDNERERGMVDEDAGDDTEEDQDLEDDEGADTEEDGADGADGADGPDDDDSELAALAPGAPEGDYEWTRRRLCPDGACVGVLGANQVCSVCGKSAA